MYAPTIRGTIRPASTAASQRQQQQSNNQPTPYTREEHLSSYLNDEILKRSTRKVSQDKDVATYDTIFRSITGENLILRVHWPLLTPQTQIPPSMILAGVNARHPWLDSRMRVVGYEPIETQSKWLKAHILLGQCVHAVVKHLQLNPPEIIEITDAALRAQQQPKTVQQQQQQQHQNQNQPLQYIRTSTINNSGRSPVTSTTRQRVVDSSTTNTLHPSVYAHEAPPNYEDFQASTASGVNNIPGNNGGGCNFLPEIDMAPIPNKFEQVDQMDRSEVEKLLNDEKEFTLFCNQLPIIQSYQKMLSSSVMEDNLVQAEKNLNEQKELQTLYDEIIQLQNQFKETMIEFQVLEKEQNQQCQPPDTKVIIKELTKLKKDAFEESEQIAERWLENTDPNGENESDQDIDTFITAFLEKRKLHHERAAKLELLLLNSHD